jgi:hypothetical protein
VGGTDGAGSGIAGYLVSEDPTPPTSADTWLASAPTTFTFAPGYGSKTIYAWTIDQAGWVSLTGSVSLTYAAP